MWGEVLTTPWLDNSRTPTGMKWHTRNIGLAHLRESLEAEPWAERAAKADPTWRQSREQLEQTQIDCWPADSEAKAQCLATVEL